MAGPYYQQVPPPGAQNGAPPPPAPPTINLEQPPLPPLAPRNRYYHDGFYLRLSSGFGGIWSSTHVDHSDATASVHGGGTAFDVMIGGTPAPGLVIGAAGLLEWAFAPSSNVNGSPMDGLTTRQSNSGTLVAGMLGPMIDAFPNPSGGFHFGGTLGFAGVNLRGLQDKATNGAQRTETGSGGAGVGTWVGYTWWASSQWSIGGMLRFTAAWTGRKVPDDVGNLMDARDTTTSTSLMFTAVYH
jgi:hypothetical protein